MTGEYQCAGCGQMHTIDGLCDEQMMVATHNLRVIANALEGLGLAGDARRLMRLTKTRRFHAAIHARVVELAAESDRHVEQRAAGVVAEFLADVERDNPNPTNGPSV